MKGVFVQQHSEIRFKKDRVLGFYVDESSAGLSQLLRRRESLLSAVDFRAATSASAATTSTAAATGSRVPAATAAATARSNRRMLILRVLEIPKKTTGNGICQNLFEKRFLTVEMRGGRSSISRRCRGGGGGVRTR